MRFEHTIVINDPQQKQLTQISQDQLWRGLVLKALNPVPFQLGLEKCEILEQSRDQGNVILKRKLDFGAFEVLDQVCLRADQQIHTHVPASDTWPRCQASVSIEQSADQPLQLRFTYEWDEPTSVDPLLDQLHRIREQAYVASDHDTVAHIRQLVQENLLPLH